MVVAEEIDRASRLLPLGMLSVACGVVELGEVPALVPQGAS